MITVFIDRNLVKNLVLGYLHASDSKKPEVLHLVSKILSVSDDELTQALGKGGGWFVRLWGKPATRTDTQVSWTILYSLRGYTYLMKTNIFLKAKIKLSKTFFKCEIM